MPYWRKVAELCTNTNSLEQQVAAYTEMRRAVIARRCDAGRKENVALARPSGFLSKAILQDQQHETRSNHQSFHTSLLMRNAESGAGKIATSKTNFGGDPPS